MGSKGMVIGNEKKTGILLLHPDEILQGAEVISKVQVSCWSYAADYGLHIFSD